MPLTIQQTRLAETIDTQVTQVLAHGGGDEAMLLSMADDMSTSKQLLGVSARTINNLARKSEIPAMRGAVRGGISSPG
jgi:hypothetical protein